MKKIIIPMVKQFLFWMLLFAVSRLIFFIYYSGIVTIENISIDEVLLSFWYALPLDISTASYLLVFPFIILFIQAIFKTRWLNYLNIVYTTIVLLVYLLITTSEIGIYEEWKTKLHYKAINYISHPAEIYNSSDTSVFFILISIFITQFALFFLIYKRFIFEKSGDIEVKWINGIILYVSIPILLFIGIRGGISEIPITQSASYFSKHNFINLASVNSGYSLLISTIENYRFKDSNPYGFYHPEKAKQRVQKLHYVENDTTIKILNTERPNIVILILESWSADLIVSLGGKEGITPQFRSLEKEGVLFTNFYASGNRSEQAMSAIFGGFPATPITAITHNLDKITRLPSLTKVLEENGYSTAYYFGGELMYGGIKSYITVNGFNTIKEIHDFSNKLPRGKLGIHDEYIFTEQLNDLKDQKQPFLSSVFTLSTHSPYDQPMEDVIFWGADKNQNGYLNSAYYTDKCLGDYFKESKMQSWYDSTLFIIVADHSHNTYNNWPVFTKEYRKIPMLFYGNVIKDEYKGTKINRISSQTDIAATLLSQLNINSNDFFWSRNILNPSLPEFAYFETGDGVGWVSHYGYFVYNNTIDDFQVKQIEPQMADSIVMDGKSYLQELFQQFMDY
jgi:phosphoglycerol transferase MdoB-like AlkP superfamily enzyme